VIERRRDTASDDLERRGGATPDGSGREARIARVVAECADRVNLGGVIDVESVVSRHPDLAPELGHALDALLSLDARGPTPVGRRLGDFRLVSEIGRGGMGVVYEARQESLERRVALKLLPPSLLVREDAVRRFVREARVAARLRHPHVVATYGMGIEDETPYFAMEYVEGETLEDLLARQRRGEPSSRPPFDRTELRLDSCVRIAELFAGAAEGLHHAHVHGVVHRDLKPSNLILDADGRLRILDFGLARLEGLDSLTAPGDLVGTPVYMSPEQATRRGIEVGPASDIYSLGATLYEAITGRPPLRGRDARETLDLIRDRDPVPLRRLQPRVPLDLETIVLRCLRKDARDRYATAEGLAQDLRRFARGDAIEARPPSRIERALRRARRHAQAIGVITLIALLAGVSVWLALDQKREIHRRKVAEYRPRVEAAGQLLSFGMDAIPFFETSGRRELEPEVFFGTPMVELLGTDRRELARRAREELDVACRELPGRPEAYYHRARAHLLLDRPGEARRDLDRAERRDPEFVPALVLRATLEDRAGNGARAAELRDRAAERAESPWSAAWVRAQRAMAARDWGDTEVAFAELIALESRGARPVPGHAVEPRIGRGIALSQLERAAEARDEFVVARALSPGAVLPGLLLARAHLSLAEDERAAAVFEQLFREARHPDEVAGWIAGLYFARSDYERGLAWTERIEDPLARDKGLAYFLVELERFAEAEAAARRLIDAYPDQSVGYTLLGYVVYRRYRLTDPSRLTLAFEMSQKAYEVDPEDAVARCAYGIALVESGQLEAGIAMLRSAIEREPRLGLAHDFLGTALEREGRVEEAIEAYERALAVSPGDPDSNAHLGLLHLRRGAVERAGPFLVRAVEADPTNLHARIGHAGYLAASGDPEEAVLSLREIVRAAPSYPVAREMLARALEEAGQVEEAAAELRALVRMTPDARFYVLLADLFSRNGDRQAAAANLEKASRAAPRDAALHARRAALLLDLGRRDQAEAAFAEVLRLDPDNSEALRFFGRER